MKIKALITDVKQIKRLMQNLGIPDYRGLAPPKLPGKGEPPAMKSHPQQHFPDFEVAA